MDLINAAYVQLSSPIVRFLDKSEPAVDTAAKWLCDIRSGRNKHKDVVVQACKVARREPIGNKRIDAMVDRVGGFMPGDVMSDIQSSSFIRAHSDVGNNGLVVAKPGDLRAFDLNKVYESKYNSSEDLFVLNGIRDYLDHLTRDGFDEKTTLVRVMHVRDKPAPNGRPPVVTHGWLLFGDRGQLLMEQCLNPVAVGVAMMARAKADISLEHFSPYELLRIEEGCEEFVAPAVRERAAEMEAWRQASIAAGYVRDFKNVGDDQGEATHTQSAPRG
ncbi:MAG: hypothetical protein EPN79_11495 [Burkholderiaceae bacterium]|nr:MAG: hypothetical protein EPN79_11495 [Burkholderiaceae bacterium]TBR76691.1 MAG: hypothetical protein EPN64_05570 [Burkholderiaceae bacterium]